MRLQTRKGTKSELDLKLYISAQDEAVRFEDILIILKFLFENEDRIYPQSRGFKGRKMLMEAISDLGHGVSIGEIKRRYKLLDGNQMTF